LLLIKSPRVTLDRLISIRIEHMVRKDWGRTSKEVEYEDEAVGFGEDRMDLQIWLEKVEVCLRNDGPICGTAQSSDIQGR
jgi:hypothetical protein